jgi:hypothetical protein
VDTLGLAPAEGWAAAARASHADSTIPSAASSSTWSGPTSRPVRRPDDALARSTQLGQWTPDALVQAAHEPGAAGSWIDSGGWGLRVGRGLRRGLRLGGAPEQDVHGGENEGRAGEQGRDATAD